MAKTVIAGSTWVDRDHPFLAPAQKAAQSRPDAPEPDPKPVEGSGRTRRATPHSKSAEVVLLLRL